ncbi:DNA repair and recombination protein RadB [Candidatus Woesearchaeota archaeon]|nr:DNA repair and recombination protein RadB [Candidatus Woesearchaeota archaeon]
MDEKSGSGCDVLDSLLDGGYECGVVTTIYGPAGSGKTTACLLASISVASSGRKVVFIDTEGGLSVTRLAQLAGSSVPLDSILFLKPVTFEEQKGCLARLRSVVNSRVGLVVVDTITSLYRSERSDDNSELNRELGRQVSFLVEAARRWSIPVIVTNQVYSGFDGRKDVRMVGGDIISYNSKCLIELRHLHGSRRAAFLQKHRYLPQKEELFEIKSEGFLELREKGFRVF